MNIFLIVMHLIFTTIIAAPQHGAQPSDTCILVQNAPDQTHPQIIFGGSCWDAALYYGEYGFRDDMHVVWLHH